MAHNSMMPSIKCSSCGIEVNLMELGEHSCTRVSVEKIDSPPFDQPATSTAPENDISPDNHLSTSSDTLQVPASAPQPAKRPTSPLKHELSLDTSSKTENVLDIQQEATLPLPQQTTEEVPDDFDALAPRALRPKPPPINSTVPYTAPASKDPLTPADSLYSADGTTDESKPSADLPSVNRHLAPPTPMSATIPSANTNFRPPSLDPQQHDHQQQLSPDSWSQSSVQSPPFMQSASAPISPQSLSSPDGPQLGLFPPLRPNMSKSTSNLSDPSPILERKKPEDNKILNLFRRKSTKPISKRTISAPSLTKSTMALDNIPAVPIMSPRLMPGYSAMTLPPSVPTSPDTGADRSARALPSGPPPPRPSRPATVIIDQLHATGVLPPSRSLSPERPPPAIPTAPDSPDKELPAPPTPDKDTAPASPDKDLPPPPPRVESPALPQIPEVEPSQEDDDSGASTARQRSESRSQSRSRSHSRSPKVSQQLPMSTSIEDLPRPVVHTHSPTGSSSSRASQPVSESHTDGSVSTPPMTSMSSFTQWKTPDEEVTSPSEHVQHPANRAANFSRPRGTTTSSSSSLSQPRGILRQSASTDFAAPSHNTKLVRESTLSSVSSGTNATDDHAPEGPMTRPRLPPIPDEGVRTHSRAPSRAGSVKNKGNCRGCGSAILGKSVKASDGRLTGRYHKECFVCKTCKEPFPSAEFYVINDEPYCHTHYHVLNGSTCFQCRKGIEGQFLQIFPNRKFHAICFSCCECRKPLSRDYYESNGQFYCEADARRIFHSGRNLAPGRMMMPERRVPALMRA